MLTNDCRSVITRESSGRRPNSEWISRSRCARDQESNESRTTCAISFYLVTTPLCGPVVLASPGLLTEPLVNPESVRTCGPGRRPALQRVSTFEARTCQQRRRTSSSVLDITTGYGSILWILRSITGTQTRFRTCGDLL